MRTKIILAVLFLVVGIINAQTYHTLNIDGLNDFKVATEKFNTTSNSTLPAYVTWDNQYLYVGFSGSTPSGTVTDNDRAYHIYLDTDPQSNPTTGTGSVYGSAWRFSPMLPFTANYHYAFKTVNNEEVKQYYNNSFWANATFATNNWKGAGFWEARIKLSDIGNPTKIYLVAYVEEDWNNGFICGGLPSGLFTNTNTQGAITFNNAFLGFELQQGIIPNASYNLNNTTFDKWDIKVTASVNSLSDNCYAGMAYYATDGFDTLIDLPKPGFPPSNYLGVYFEHNDWSTNLGNFYSKDIKLISNLSNNIKTWTFKVNTDQTNQLVTLVFSEFADVPNNYNIILKDLTNNTTQDIRTNQNYTFNSGTNSVRTFELTVGVQTEPNITVNPTSLSFGNVTVNASSNLTLKIKNTGSANLSITNITSGNSVFTFSGGTTYTIQPNDSVSVTVTFTPTAATTYSSNLTITSNDPDQGTLTVPLSGTGTALQPNITVNPTSLNFANVAVGSISTLTVTVTNDGQADLNVTNVILSNGVFTYSGNTTFTLAPAANNQLSIKFKPINATTYNGTLRIVSNSPGEDTVTVTLTGVGTTSNFSNKFNAGWSLMSIPLTPNNPTASSVIGSVINPFYLYGYNDNGGYISKDTLFIGSGYWLGIEDTATISVSGLGNTSTINKALNNGWNLVANPFINNLHKSAVKFTKDNQTVTADQAVTLGWIQNSYYEYNTSNSSYSLSDTLKKWKGYWFASLTNNLTMKFEAPTLTESTTTNKPDNEPSVNDWKVNILAKIDTQEDNLLSFGANAFATDGFDAKYDLAKPPVSPSSNNVYTYFNNINGSIFTKFANDIKKSFNYPDEGKTWSFVVNTNKSGTVTLSWNNIANLLPAAIKDNYKFKLSGYGLTTSLDMLLNTSYQFNADANTPYTFVINGIITDVEENKTLNYDYKLMQNYPNPFNPSTIIAFTLPNATFVSLKVYDLLGKEVATLVNEELQSGYHQVNFNAKDLSGGVYFYTIKAGSFTNTKKLVLLK